ncbi:MAG TPA: NYN domain-containing protein [Oculatellaceae cyanobacterium]
MPNRTIVYVDGFNLYYGALKGTPHKWLNLHQLCEFYLKPEYHKIVRINYFTAKVSGTPDDNEKPQRQMRYIRALRTLPTIEVIDGHFIVERILLPNADGSGPVEVINTKEKKSDVNLASLMLWDAHCNNFDTAAIVSGDSDFETPLDMVRERFKKQVVVLDPQRSGTPNSPMNRKNIYKPIRAGALAGAQFPIQLTDAQGLFAKPQEWFATSAR